jgi:hypothetical protein
MSVEGDAAVVTLHSSAGGVGSRVRVDRIARGFTAAEFATRDAARPLSLCGANADGPLALPRTRVSNDLRSHQMQWRSVHWQGSMIE